MLKCFNCGKETNEYENYCNWDCMIESAEKQGGKKITPNNLPIKCIMADGTMLECENGDHPDYKFPVIVEWVGKTAECSEQYDFERANQLHAFIYTDGNIALTLYECCYYMWKISDGRRIGSLDKEWELTKDSREKVIDYCKNNGIRV